MCVGIGRVVGQLDAGGGVEVSAIERLGDHPRLERLGAHVDPSAPRSGRRRIAGPLEVMRIIHRDAVEQPSAGEEPVPHLLEARDATAADVVDLRMTVVDLEQTRAAPRAPGRSTLTAQPKFGWFDVRHARPSGGRRRPTTESLRPRRQVTMAAPHSSQWRPRSRAPVSSPRSS